MNTKNGSGQKVLIFGLGQFGKGLLKKLAPVCRVTVVDHRETEIARCKEEVPDADYVHGAAESVLTWKKLNLDNLKFIISAVRSNEVDLEVCRIARKEYKLKIPILVLVYNEVDEKLFAPYNATIINPLELGIGVVLKKMTTHVSFAANVGLEEGELVEVTVKARSHLVDKKLKYLHPTSWHIAALYRSGNLIIPEGNTTIKVGDRVLLVGPPNVLKNVTDIYSKGLPQFPLQYGPNILFPLQAQFLEHMDESIYWLDSFKAQRLYFAPFKHRLSAELREKIKGKVQRFKIGEPVERFAQLLPPPQDTGILVIPQQGKWLKYNRLRTCCKKSVKPFFLSRKTFPYEGVVIGFNGPDPGQAMEVGVEIAKLLNIPYRAYYVTLPKQMRGREQDTRLRLRRRIITDYQSIYKSTIPYDVLEGNPVRRSLKYLEPLKNHLLILVINPNDPISIFRPNVSYLVSKNTHLSTLVIPESFTNE
jgi:Trk K+ transport system NAD-binding subunit